MTGEGLRNRVRAFLDEPVPDFRSDDEVYHALGEGVSFLIEKSCAFYKREKWAASQVLKPLVMTFSEMGVSGGAVNLPPDYYRLVSVRYASKSMLESERKEAKIIEVSEQAGIKINPFLKDSYFVYEYQGVLRFSSPLYDGSYDLVYLRAPGAPAAAWESPFDSFAGDLLVKYACSALILKDNKPDISAYLMKEVLQTLLQKGDD